MTAIRMAIKMTTPMTMPATIGTVLTADAVSKKHENGQKLSTKITTSDDLIDWTNLRGERAEMSAAMPVTVGVDTHLSNALLLNNDNKVLFRNI